MVDFRRNSTQLSFLHNRPNSCLVCLNRVRGAFSLIIAAALVVAVPDLAQAQQKFPSKPIRVVIAVPAGSQTDAIARMIGQKMSESWGKPVVVENRPGAGGILAGNLVAKATPDGYTLLMPAAFAIGAALQVDLPYNPLKDFAGITQIGFSTQALVVAPALGAKSVKDLIALGKSQPGKMISSSGSVASISRLNGERFQLAAGIKVVNVAFKAGVEALIETLAGRTHFSFASLSPALPFIKDGKLLALAVTTPQRSPVLPDVPALAETLPDFRKPESSIGLLAPANTPRPILSQISREVARILELPDVKERMQGMGSGPAPTTPAEYDAILRDQIETLTKLARDIGLRPKG